MNKLIQTITLTMVVFSPLSLIALVTSVSAHHTGSHLSTVAVETTINKKKKKAVTKLRRSTKPKATTSSKKKTTAPETNTSGPETGVPSSGSTPPAGSSPKTKPTPSPSSKINRIDPLMGNPISKKDRNTQLPPANSGIPNIPLEVPGNIPNPAGNTPSIPRPNFPNVPGG